MIEIHSSTGKNIEFFKWWLKTIDNGRALDKTTKFNHNFRDVRWPHKSICYNKISRSFLNFSIFLLRFHSKTNAQRKNSCLQHVYDNRTDWKRPMNNWVLKKVRERRKNLESKKLTENKKRVEMKTDETTKFINQVYQ